MVSSWRFTQQNFVFVQYPSNHTWFHCQEVLYRTRNIQQKRKYEAAGKTTEYHITSFYSSKIRLEFF
jgi:hypothetical protein